jgi:hypothetical protein
MCTAPSCALMQEDCAWIVSQSEWQTRYRARSESESVEDRVQAYCNDCSSAQGSCPGGQWATSRNLGNSNRGGSSTAAAGGHERSRRQGNLQRSAAFTSLARASGTASSTRAWKLRHRFPRSSHKGSAAIHSACRWLTPTYTAAEMCLFDGLDPSRRFCCCENGIEELTRNFWGRQNSTEPAHQSGIP